MDVNANNTKKYVSLQTNLKNYSTVIKPKVSYAGKTYNFTVKLFNRTYRKRNFMRKIIGARKTHDGY